MENIERTCEKEQYNTYQDVVKAMDGLAKRGIKKLRSYKCDECLKYHITSIKSGQKKSGNRGKDKKFTTKMAQFIKSHKKKSFRIPVTKEEIEKGRLLDKQKDVTDLFLKLQSFIFKNL